MGRLLKSLGLDLGTATTSLVVSELEVEDRSTGFSVPRLEIGGRRVVYRSPIYATPLVSGELVDGEALKRILETEYRAGGLDRQEPDTGAVIVTGETSRKENARRVLEALARQAGKFVVATAGPDLESILAARGAGAAELSRELGKPVVHLDIGGGTANLALCRDGEAAAAGCLNVGGKAARFDSRGTLLSLSPGAAALTKLRVGDRATREEAFSLAAGLVRALEEAVGLRPETALSRSLRTPGATVRQLPAGAAIRFSGGVGDCVYRDGPWLEYGDLGPSLGRAIRESLLCAGDHGPGRETVRATVIGAGCHSVTLSGSTVFWQNVDFPLVNLPVVRLTAREQDSGELEALLRRRLEGLDTWPVLALPGWEAPDHGRIRDLARVLAAAYGDRPCYLAIRGDMAKALGTALALRRGPEASLLALDGLCPGDESYLDIQAPVGPAVTVVEKTLVFGGRI